MRVRKNVLVISAITLSIAGYFICAQLQKVWFTQRHTMNLEPPFLGELSCRGTSLENPQRSFTVGANVPPRDMNSCASDCAGVPFAGDAPYCTIVSVSEYAWSESDKLFYFHISYADPVPIINRSGCNDTGLCEVEIEYQRTSGWIPQTDVVAPYNGPTPTPSVGISTTSKIISPSIPTYLTALPIIGRIRCDLNPSIGIDILFANQYEHPDIILWKEPIPTISPSSLGENYPNLIRTVRLKEQVPVCAEIQILDYAWSNTDRAFFLLIKHQATGYKGWIKKDYVDLTQPQLNSKFKPTTSSP